MNAMTLLMWALLLSAAIGTPDLTCAQVPLKPGPTPLAPQPLQPKQTVPERLGLPAAPPPAPPKTVFVTSATYTGNLGGVAGADWHCQQLAAAAGLPGTYKAWLAEYRSGVAAGPATTFTHNTGPYKRVDGVVVANDWTSLLTKPLLSTICTNERGVLVPNDASAYVWSAVSIAMTSGAITYMPSRCDEWLSERADFDRGNVGYVFASSFSGDWTNMLGGNSAPLCNTRLRLYCFQQ